MYFLVYYILGAFTSYLAAVLVGEEVTVKQKVVHKEGPIVYTELTATQSETNRVQIISRSVFKAFCYY